MNESQASRLNHPSAEGSSQSDAPHQWNQCSPADATQGVCPVCLGRTLIEIRGKLQCERCHTICETCCEGGRT
ncbi:hypothetical protein [Rhodopirellula sp. P2]|uniref:hypothetical protein n=1 Tax=Rhodopirellula sp. P2 TaxID=2127060 RepID=UPI0023687822|nr:hypothetical protein [Rhodopirellula sp. P2]WDQ17437.1 hypothetical protein PSR62_02520 [Rhodopirellula sp. P2]